MKGLIRIMTMTEMQVKSLRQWYGGDWESVIKLSWRAMAEELLDLQQADVRRVRGFPGCGQGGPGGGAEGQGCSGP